MEALKNSITLHVSVPVLSVSTVLTMPSSWGCRGRGKRCVPAASMLHSRPGAGPKASVPCSAMYEPGLSDFQGQAGSRKHPWGTPR